MSKSFTKFNAGIQILQKYNVVEFVIEPINKVSAFSHEPEFTYSAYVSIALDWDDQDKMTANEIQTLKENGWKKEDGMGLTYWTFIQQ